MTKKKFYITTPIYYLNAEPHLGHSYTTILADVIARFHRAMGEDVFFLTGTDEHGQKNYQVATQKGMDTKKFVDEMSGKFRKTWKEFNVTNDDFIRTTEERHKRVVREILMKIWEKGDIYKDEYEGWYCVYEERFWNEKDLVEGNCPDCNRPVSKIKEQNYFFKMSQYQDKLIEYIKKNPEFIIPETRRNEILSFLKNPLNDLCISRPKSRLPWGIPLPFDEDYVTYVWFDALINYLSAIGYSDDKKKFNKFWPADIHFIAKDIVTTHSVYWPTMLMAMELPLPKTILTHGFWLFEEKKMSKSLGNVVRPIDMKDIYGVDAIRYFLMREMTMGQDCSFSESTVIRRINSDLANDLGNLLNRTLTMIQSYFQGVIPEPEKESKEDKQLEEFALTTRDKVVDLIDKIKPNLAIESILELVRATNKYIVTTEPWMLYKEDKKDKLATVLFYTLESIRFASIMLYPIMPEKMKEINRQLGIEINDDVQFDDVLQWGLLKSGIKIKQGELLFPKIEVEKKTKLQKEEGKKVEQKEEAGLVSIDEFKKIKLKTAKIIEAERVQGTEKLMKMKVDVGGEIREIVAGIAAHYKAEDLIGKIIILVANLKPATIKGIKSNGMLLAAVDKDKLALVTLDDKGKILPGTLIS